jgi:hypothetical protein
MSFCTVTLEKLTRVHAIPTGKTPPAAWQPETRRLIKQDKELQTDSSLLPLRFTKQCSDTSKVPATAPVNYYTARLQDILSAMPWELE